MARLIDADALIKYMCDHCGANCNLEDECCFNVDAVENQPTVDAVVHGWWYWADDGYCRCAKCHQKAPVIRQWDDEPVTTMTNYCPHCGAKMDGDEP